MYNLDMVGTQEGHSKDTDVLRVLLKKFRMNNWAQE